VADLLPSERLQPCLLDRLTDQDPDQRKEGREQRVVSMRKYREAVLRDLGWLLNTGNLANLEELDGFKEVQSSVVNYGMPDLCGLTASGLDPIEIEESLVEAIRTFEPRILPHTLEVRSVPVGESGGANSVSFEIQGQLWAQPTHEALFIRTEVDLETGQFAIKESGR
jgi:type VI secretion system protein ImpF